jgi:hypothetical protein
MKKIIIAIVLPLLFLSISFSKDVKVKGYFRKDGTYVAPYTRSRPNAFKWDNKSYTPSQPAYNKSYFSPTKNYGADWYTPSETRFSDTNPHNDFPSLNIKSYNPIPIKYNRIPENNLQDDIDIKLFRPTTNKQVKKKIKEDVYSPYPFYYFLQRKIYKNTEKPSSLEDIFTSEYLKSLPSSSSKRIKVGDDVEYYDWETGEYKSGETESIYGNEMEIYNYETGEYDYIDVGDVE